MDKKISPPELKRKSNFEEKEKLARSQGLTYIELQKLESIEKFARVQIPEKYNFGGKHGNRY